MMKQTKFLIAASIVALASSCNSGTAGDPAADAAKIDSMANARLDELKLELMARNDSTIMALARERADSILVSMGNKPTPKPQPKRVISRDKGTATTNTGEKDSPKDETKGTVNDRPGATNGGNKSVNDRPGATNSGDNKSVNDRPGATNN